METLENDFEEMALKITDLPVDALSQILSSVAKSSDGATEVAKSMTICKCFLEAGNNHTVFKSVCFQGVEVASRYDLFQKTEGLLYKCASFGNLSAQFLLAQVLLKSCTQLKRIGIKPSTLKNFREYSPRCDGAKFQGYLSASLFANVVPGKGPRPFSYHWELVKLFLSKCNAIDIYNMHEDIQAYVEYFTGSYIRSGTNLNIMQYIYIMFDRKNAVIMLIGYFFLLGEDMTFALKRLMGDKSPTRSENGLCERMRVKVLEEFDRVSCEFSDFVVPEKEE